MAQENLRYKVDADTKGFDAGMAKVQSRLRKTQGGTRRQSQAFTQLAYAMDDAQYGFRGIQNNLQQIAVTAGASGPIVLGITAILVVLGYFIDKVDLFTDKVGDLRKELSELNKVTLSTDDQSINLAKQLNVEIEKRLKRIGEIEEKQKRNGKQLQETFRLERDQLQTELAINDAVIARAVRNKEDIADKKKQKQLDKERADQLKRIKDSEDLSPFSIESGEDNDFLTVGLQDIIDNFNPNSIYPAIVDVDDVLVLDESDLDLFDGLFEDEVPAFKEKANELGAALQSSLTSAFSGIGEAIGEALVGDGDIGEKFLKLLGSFMQQFGAALIAVGVAELALSSGNPFLMIAGGVALIAAGSAISASRKNKPSLSGNSSGSGASATSVTPTSVQGNGGNSISSYC